MSQMATVILDFPEVMKGFSSAACSFLVRLVRYNVGTRKKTTVHVLQSLVAQQIYYTISHYPNRGFGSSCKSNNKRFGKTALLS